MPKNAVINVCVALVLYGESPYVMETLASLRQQELDEATNLSLVVVDNGIPDNVRSEIFQEYDGKFLLIKNMQNLGFSAAVNQVLEEACSFNADFLLLLNPDLLLETVAVRELIRSAKKNPEGVLFSPKLIRANQDLSPSEPSRLDACGMIINSSLRHLDRGSSEIDNGQYQAEQEVFGGTGACLLIRLQNISDLLLPRGDFEKDLWKIYPQLEQGAEIRLQLMDESFFAYREDADLCFRAQILGKKVFYCPLSVGYHVRHVLPEKRKTLPSEINMWSVRNRFLLQINNLKPIAFLKVFINGFLLRNILVIFAVLFYEKTSRLAFKHLWILRKRALDNRKYIMNKTTFFKYRARLNKFFN